MLVAVGTSGRRYTAGEDLPEVPHCPDCGDEVVVRHSPRRVPHFAHFPHRRCTAAAARAARRRAQADARRVRRARAAAAAAESTGQPGLFDLEVADPAS